VNYRHSFHAGNFADLVKHAAVLSILSRLQADPSPLRVVDTHAGAGLYDLTSVDAKRSREAEAGVARLAQGDLPAPLAALRAAVRRRNPDGPIRLYPGSPALVLERLRPQDSFVGCELRPDDHGRLQSLATPSGVRAKILQADGFATLTDQARSARERLFGLIDPPFERADDYVRIVEAVGETLAVRPDAVLLIWLPLKDLETFDSFLRRLERVVERPTLVAETRLRPLHDPLKMNGCALVSVNTPQGVQGEIEQVCASVARGLGEAGGRTKVWLLAA
jgi:23S rRNA (adenine2030-N6)-methyltransferase